jgi:hypothetical protein
MNLKLWWNNNKELLLKRIKSFLWRLCSVMLVAGLSWISQNITGFGLPDWAVAGVGLLIGEITKWINSNTNLFGIKK